MSQANLYQTPEAELDEDLYHEYQPAIFSFNGRIGRLRYLAYNALYSIIGFAVMGVLVAIFGAAFAEGSGAMVAIVVVVAAGYLAIIVGTFAVVVRRLNDLGHSGWFSLLLFVPVINLLLGLYLLFGPGQLGPNQYGPQPCKNHGVLWIALLAPFAFIGLLAAIALPAYQDYVERAQQHQFEE